MLYYAHKQILAVQFGTCDSDLTVTHQEIFSMEGAGVTEISHDIVVKFYSESQTVNVFK